MILSVIIPVYNVEAYLVRCIESLKGVDPKQVEVILIDDGSKDASPKICGDYQKKYSFIRVIHKENGGLSSARNVGIKNALGEYICLLDSDDMLTEDFIPDMLRLIDQYQPDLIDFNCCEERVQGQFALFGDKSVTEISQRNFIEKLVKNQIGCQSWLRLYKKQLFDGTLYPLKKYYEDIFIIWKILLKVRKILHVNYSYYIYNIFNTNSITKKTNAKHMSDMKQAFDELYNGLYEYCQTHQIDMDCLKYVKLNGYVYIGYKIRNASEDVSQLRRDINKYIKENPINLIKFCKGNYDWKKYIIYRLLTCFFVQ